MRNLVILALVFAIGIGAYLLLREDGVLEQVTEARVAEALLDNGVPPTMTQCMAPRLVDRLSITQLRKLERLAPQKGEAPLPGGTLEVLARLERVDDQQAVRVLGETATRCGVESLLELS
ncbi:MAG: hypothetical protein V2J51_05860 [Erythrobacter sp.]|jgi:hypothetical protein|nr:hypothetical protein [Erythrobacter sp.]